MDISAKKVRSDEGEWTTLDGFGDCNWRIVRATDRSVIKGRQAIITRDYARKSKRNSMTDLDHIDLGMKLAAEYILVDWENVQDDGKDVEYSPEQCLEYLRKIPDLMGLVNEFSIDDSNYVGEEETAKKSGTP